MPKAATRPKKNPPGRPHGTTMDDSLPTRLCMLDLGMSESKAIRLELAEATTAEVTACKEKLSSTIRKAAARASDRSGFRFEVYTGDFRTQTDHVVVSAVATRVG